MFVLDFVLLQFMCHQPGLWRIKSFQLYKIQYYNNNNKTKRACLLLQFMYVRELKKCINHKQTGVCLGLRSFSAWTLENQVISFIYYNNHNNNKTKTRACLLLQFKCVRELKKCPSPFFYYIKVLNACIFFFRSLPTFLYFSR